MEKMSQKLSMSGSAELTMFLKSTANGLGGAFKGLGTSIESQTLKEFGDYLEQKYTIAPPKTKDFSDLLDVTNLTKLSGQLAGGMAPSIAAAAAATAVTGGAGAGAGTQMIVGGLASWAAETADMAGRSYNDMFAKTGIVADAEKASQATIDSQTDIILAYSADALPFVGDALSSIGSKAGRVATGAAIEVGTELPQELLQNIAEENISEGENAWKDLGDKLLDTKRLKETLISIAPVAIMGGAGQVNSQSRSQQLADIYAAKESQAKLSDVVEDQGRQFIQNLVFGEGAKTARSTVAAMFTGGQIDQAKADEMNAQINQSERIKQSADAAKLSGNDRAIYSFYAARSQDALAKSESTQDPILSKVYADQAKDYEQAAVDFLQGKDPDFFSIKYKDGSEFLMTTADAEDAFANNKLQQEINAGNVQIAAFGKGSAKQLTEYESKVKAEARINTIREKAADIRANTKSNTAEVLEEIKKGEDGIVEQKATTETVTAKSGEEKQKELESKVDDLKEQKKST